jgi:hypothetical protein
MTPREELEALRRLDELERKAQGGQIEPVQPVQSRQATTPPPPAKKAAVAPSKASVDAFAPVKEPEMFAKNGKPLMPGEVITDETIPFNSLYQDDAKFKVVNDFMKTIDKPYDGKQSKEEFVKDYMAKMRMVEMNTIGAASMFNRLANTDKATAAKLANAWVMYDKVASALSDEGQGGIRPYWDTAKAIVTDPTNYAGAGAAAVVKSTVGRAAVRSALRNRMQGFLTAAAVDTPIAFLSDLQSQKLEHSAEQKRDAAFGETPEQIDERQKSEFKYNKARGAFSVALSVLGSAASGAAVSGTAKTGALAEKMKTAPITAPSPQVVAKAKAEVIDGINRNIDDEVKKFVKEQGEQVLSQVGPASALADAKVRTSLTGNAVNIAMNIIKSHPNFKLKQGEQISDTINRVLSQLDKVDDLTLEAAMRKSNVNVTEMASAVKVSQSEAARELQQLSVAKRLLNRLEEVDPQFKKQMADLYKGFDQTDGKMTMFFNGVKRLERESKAWITSGVDTTVRNMMGSVIGITAKSAARLGEGITYSIYKATEALVTGKPAQHNLGGNLTRTWEDTTRMFKYLKDAGLSKEITDELLKDNPTLQRRLLSTQEDDRNISKIGVWAQTLNHYQDQFYRRAVFAESIDRQMQDVGLNLFEVMRDGKLIPKDVVARATDDALKATFSYMPNSSFGGKMKDPITGKMVNRQTGIDAMFERGAGWLVQGIENTPFASLAVPFPRFMANAMAFQYRHSPFGMISAAGDFARLRGAAKAGADEATQVALRHQALEHSMQAVAGTAALAFAINYRKENQDTTWGQLKNDDGSVTDVRSIFPTAPYLVVADAWVKLHGSALKGDNQGEGVPFNSKELIETLIGMKTPAGTQNTFIDTIVNSLNSDDAAEEFTKSVGKMFGDFAGRFTQPFVVKQVYDFVDAMRGEDIARDPSITELTGWGGLGETAVQTVQAKLPIVKESLPKAVPKFEESEDIERKGEFFARIFGARSSYEGSELNQEFNRLGLVPYKLVGRRTGNRVLDNKIIEAINAKVLPDALSLINSPTYANQKSDLERRADLTKMLSEQVEKVRADVIASADAASKAKIWYRSQSNTNKARIRAEYKRRTGKDIEEEDDYTKAEGLLKGLNEVGYNKGGFVSRR